MRARLNRKRLIEILAQSRLSQNHWAMKLGLSRGHLSDLVNGRHPYPSGKTRDRLVEGLKVPFDELFDLEPDERQWVRGSGADFQTAIADRYLIDREIGQGGMGTVYLARDIKHGRVVAIKVVSPEAVSGVGAAPFLKEIRRTAQLQHPHILTLLDSGEAAGYPYYVMPYIRGGSLRDLLKNKQQLQLGEAISIAHGVSAALKHAHENRVIHCDIKPENILIDDGHAYLADFGISRALHAEVRAWRRRGEIDSSAGTPAYVSPEQATGEELDGRSDIYSLGCVVFEMISGRRPFDGTTTMEVVARRFTDRALDLRRVAPHIPAGVAVAVEKAMASDVSRRYQTADQFLKAIEQAAAAESVRPLVAAAGLTKMRVSRVLRRIGSGLGGMPAVSTVLQDMIYSLRSLRRRPAQTAILVLTLALGIGVNSAMFSIVSTVLLRPLPYPESDRLVALWESERGSDREVSFTYPNFVDVRDQSQLFEEVAAYFDVSLPVSGGGPPVRVPGYFASEEFFHVLDVTPQLGGAFPRQQNTGLGATNVVLGDAFWRSNLGGDPDVVGRILSVSGRPATVVGVMPAGFAFPRGAALWMIQDLTPFYGPSRTAHNVRAIARIATDVSAEAAQTEMSTLAARLAADHSDEIADDFDIAVVPLHEELVADARESLVLLSVVVGVVLIIACGNIASILLSQALARNKELAIRRAIGAGSARLVRQMFTESALIGLVGGAAGLLLSVLSLSLTNAIVPEDFLHSGAVALDWRIVVFTMTLGLLTGLLFGVLPAWQATRHQPASVLRTDGSEVLAGSRRRRTGGLFVVPQYAFSLSALIVAGLILKSLMTLSDVDPGFRTDGIVTVELDLPFSPPSPYGDRNYAAEFYRRVLNRVRSLPGVRDVTLDLAPPLSSPSALNGGVQREDEDFESRRWDKYADWRPVGSGYFRTMGIPLLRGRDFEERDAEQATPVAIVNQSLVQLLWGDEDPMGRRLRLSSLDNDRAEAARDLTVVGVVPDVHHRRLDRDPRAAVYAPILQHLDRVRSMDLVIAGTGPLDGYAGPVRDIIRELDPELPLGRIETMEGWTQESISEPRFRAGLLTAFGALAVALALLGVYGVMSYSVTQRRREMAVRMALGARRSDIMRLLTGEGLRYVIAGQILGLGAAIAFTRLLEGFLFGVSATDARVFSLVSVGLAMVVLLTSYLPARRAGNVEPVEVLKE